MDIRRSESDGLQSLAELASKTPGAEMEALLMNMDLTAWQDVIQYLRQLGMKERTNILKLNISFRNNIRITLEGTGIIKDYCRENRIGEDTPFTAMRKEPLRGPGATPVVLEHYGVSAKLKRETPLDPSDAEVVDMLKRWNSLDKHFRLIQRYEFDAPGEIPLRFDVSHVRENMPGRKQVRTFQESQCMSSPPKYEVEVELLRTDNPDASVRHIVRGISWLLQGRQRSYVLVSNGGAHSVRSDIQRIFASANRNEGRGGFRYPAPQPATLERQHLFPASADAIQLATFPGGYNVTDKADGLRAMMYVAPNGRIFLVDGGGRVYATGKEVSKSLAGTVLDGEWIRKNRAGERVSAYYAFDILAGANGDVRVAALPFAVAGEMEGTRTDRGTRRAAMADAVRALSGAVQKVRGVPANQNIQVGMKTFRVAGGPVSIFRDCAAAALSDAKTTPYNTDGLIFTPNAPGLPLGRGTWHQQLKWKPAHENTIDFLVVVEQERDSAGAPTGTDATKTMYREDSAQTVRYKTLRLFVASNQDVAFKDPRRTILAGEPLPSETGANTVWRAAEFRPMEPRDPMAAVCYVETDPSDPTLNGIRAMSGDVLQSDMIVEMSYHPERSPGWRWTPVRVRHDKTERWHNNSTSGTMNADWVADSIWSNIHNPVTEAAVTTGIVEGCVMGPAPRIRSRDRHSRDQLQCMLNFQNDFVKRLLFAPVGAGSSILDMACGAADDLPRWLSAGVSTVLGTDTRADLINDPAVGAYRRLLDKTIVLQERMPLVRFAATSDAAPLAALTDEDNEIIASFSSREFDMVRMDRVSSMFRTDETLANFLTALTRTVRMGGFVAGFGLDGDAVARLSQSGQGTWSITKRFDPSAGLDKTDLPFDVEQGAVSTEFIVSWSFFQSRMANAGFTLLSAEEVKGFGLPASSQMFSETLAYAEATGHAYPMPDTLKRLAHLNRWWMFKRTATKTVDDEAKRVTEAPVAKKSKKKGTNVTPAPPAPAPAPSAAPRPFVVSSAVFRDPEERLGPALADWPHYMSTSALVETPEINADVGSLGVAGARVMYPSIDAAMESEKYRQATNKPQLGPTTFRVEGTLHQGFVSKRAAAKTDDERKQLTIQEAAQMRIHSSANKMKSLGVSFDAAKWERLKPDILQAYIRQRHGGDERFRAMIDAIKARGETISGSDPLLVAALQSLLV